MVGGIEVRGRRAGRPLAIPRDLEAVVLGLYQAGYGYRAIARILREEHRINPSFTSVKRTLARLEKVTANAKQKEHILLRIAGRSKVMSLGRRSEG